MVKTDFSFGHVYLELLVACVLAGSAWLYWSASQSSESLMTNEQHACLVLSCVAEAQSDFRRQFGASRFGSLGELMGVDSQEAQFAEIGLRLRRTLETAERSGPVFFSRNYCFCVYLASSDGEALNTPVDAKSIAPDFWVAYAWPRTFGAEGRRIFVIDASGAMRSWDNQRRGRTVYEGIENPPPAHLAPAPEGIKYPLLMKPQGLQRSNIWHPEALQRP